MLVLAITYIIFPGLGSRCRLRRFTWGPATLEGFMAAFVGGCGIGFRQLSRGGRSGSIPLRRAGYSRAKSFIYGQASGIVELFLPYWVLPL
jgi:hypothetical protein